ncbi:acyl carrier protein [Tepidamorphus sp. 3E244]|uniref:acyl carrier protein n=1 Tax=Tepidamorphus sp. 3E244 TaxID=3385498 RepID=UPI0038FCD3D3
MTTQPDAANLVAARALVADIFERPAAEIPDDLSIQSEPAWDSLNHVRIIMALEEHRGRPLESEVIASLSTLQAIARAVA